MENKKLKIITPEQKRRKQDKIIMCVIFVVIVLMIGLIIIRYVGTRDHNKELTFNKKTTSTTITVTTIPEVHTVERNNESVKGVRTEKTTTEKVDKVEYVFNQDNYGNYETPVNNGYTYTFDLKGDNYIITVCLGNIATYGYDLYIDGSVYAKSETDKTIKVPRTAIDLTHAPSIIIGVGGVQYTATYNTKCR